MVSKAPHNNIHKHTTHTYTIYTLHTGMHATMTMLHSTTSTHLVVGLDLPLNSMKEMLMYVEQTLIKTGINCTLESGALICHV